MKRLLLCCALMVVTPGCLAVAAGGLAYVIGKGSEATTKRMKMRLEYLGRRRAAGASEDEILSEIKILDPEWYREIQKAGGRLPEVKRG